MSRKLLPCPFCGGRPLFVTSYDGDMHKYLAVHCVDCRAKSSDQWSDDPCPQTYEEVCDRWNIRAHVSVTNDPRVVALIEAAKLVNADHSAPHDCYATGPLTGNPWLDLVRCPGCVLSAALANLEKKES